MAEAYGKLTGRPGICLVTRGPGATNGSIGVHTAYQDSSPMILFIGQVGGDVVEREAFQEVDYRRMFGQMAKWVAQIDRAERIPEYVSHAFHLAVSGRPGPGGAGAARRHARRPRRAAAASRPYRRVKPHPGRGDLQRLREMLTRATAAVGHPGRRRLERRARAPTSARSWSGGTCRPPAPSDVRICSTTATPGMWARSASRSAPS